MSEGPFLQYTERDSDRAFKTWKASCGPHSIAAALGISLDAVRPALSAYKGWMSPTQMTHALLALKKVHNLRHHLKTQDLCDGINRVQWEGKWLNPGVPARVAYFHTHWVAHFDGWVLCTACLPWGWIRADVWRHFHLETEPRSPFHITHHYSFARPNVAPLPNLKRAPMNAREAKACIACANFRPTSEDRGRCELRPNSTVGHHCTCDEFHPSAT